VPLRHKTVPRARLSMMRGAARGGCCCYPACSCLPSQARHLTRPHTVGLAAADHTARRESKEDGVRQRRDERPTQVFFIELELVLTLVDDLKFSADYEH